MRAIQTATAGGFALTLILTGSAFAESQQSQGGAGQQDIMTFQQLDKNNDGHISQKEARAVPQLEDQWSQVDANNNDRIEAAEFAAFQASGMGQQGGMGQGGMGQGGMGQGGMSQPGQQQGGGQY